MNKRKYKKQSKITALKTAVGEISNLRDYSQPSYNTSINLSYNNPNYLLDTSRVDYKLAKELYYNSHGNYKLGAGFCKPIINVAAGFIGVPSFESEDDNAQMALDAYMNNRTNIFSEIPKKMMRDGDEYILITKKNTENNPLYNKSEMIIDFKILAPERVKVVNSPLDENKMLKCAIITNVNYKDELDNNIKYNVIEVWSETEHTVKYEDLDVPDYIKEILIDIQEINPYGFIPVVKIKNEDEQNEQFGRSDLEPVEPYIRAYHDVMLDLLKGSKLTANPKVKIKVSDYMEFLTNNFSDAEISSKQLSMSGKNIIILGTEDDAGYLEVTATTHTTLLEFIFMCIVDVSETPEFAFGTAVASSKASVSEQITPLLKKVERKRAYLTSVYEYMARMVFAISNMNITDIDKIDNFKLNVVWEEIDSTDDSIIANTIKTLIDGFVTGIENKIISPESAINFLGRYVDTMSLFDDKDKKSEKVKILEQLENFINKTSETENKEIDNIKEILEGSNPENNINNNNLNNTNQDLNNINNNQGGGNNG